MEMIPFSLSNYTLENYLIKISSRSKVIYWIIISSVISAIVILPFVFVDVSIQARGFFQSDIEKQIVNIPFQGKIVYTYIRNGDRVTKGDTLIIIDSETIRAQQAALTQRITENNESISDLGKLTGIESIVLQPDYKGLVTKRYQAEFANLKSQQAIQFQKFQKKKAEHARNELLYNQKIIPEVDFENSLFLLNSEKDNLNQILFSQKSLWQGDLAMRKNDAVNLNADFERCTEELSNRIVLASTSGEIIQSSDIQIGSIVNQGQNVAEISPDGELVANCFVKPSDIGLIHENQKVRIQVDAFNYNEWGMLEGRIIDISDDMIVESGSTAYFRVKCKTDKISLSLKNGYSASVKKGMSLNARIVVIRRSLYNLLFDKADKWFNPYTYTKE
jgi:membrane fusion protein, peptide pheromone/bacteriocin exporter